MKADGKSAKGGSDQDDKEDFGEASGRSNGGPKKNKNQRTVLEEDFGLCRRQNGDSQKKYQAVLGRIQRGDNFEEEGQKNRQKKNTLQSGARLRSFFSAAFGKSSQASATDEFQEREVMRGLSETVEVL